MRPLEGLRVVELAGIGPGPFCGMLLADLGADVVRVQRVGGHPDPWGSSPVLDRGRSAVLELDLRTPAGVAAALEQVREADVLIEGFRPGVTERLGIGPHDCLAVNPRLVYGRMTGWGQTGPYAHTAGHDITYLAVSGALHAFGRAGEPPVAPVNLLGDFGGGGMLLAFGVMCAVFAARQTGRGQVVDAAILDGTVLMSGMLHGLLAEGTWRDERGVNLLDSGAPFYDVYRCADDRHVAVGAIEHRFFRALAAELGLAEHPAFAGDHLDPTRWPAIRDALTATFATRPRDAWAEQLRDTDCCVAPVLSLTEAAEDPHVRARGLFETRDGGHQPAPAPRFAPPG
jgi:alpha-methylacyl-CoA racemase